MGSYKGAGPDSIKPIIMKNFGPLALGCITKKFQAIYSTGYIPIEFRKSRVVFIPKHPQKMTMVKLGPLDPYLSPNFYLKTMERVMEWYLRENYNDFGKISNMQHAYSGTKGTDTALSTLVNMIESSILKSEYCLVLSVDIMGAFDNLATTTIHNVMVENKYSPTKIRWYMNFLKK